MRNVYFLLKLKATNFSLSSNIVSGFSTATESSQAKRCRLHSGGKTVEAPSGEQLPEGMPEVVSKGFANIPAPPIKSPFILRRTTATAGVKTRSAARRLTTRSTAALQQHVS